MPLTALVIVIAGVYFVLKKRNSQEVATHWTKWTKHNILKKDDQLRDKIAALTNSTDALNEEFRTLENVVKEEVTDTMLESKLEDNICYNRYKDIGKIVSDILYQNFLYI